MDKNITARSLDTSKSKAKSPSQKLTKRRIEPITFATADIYHKKYLVGETRLGPVLTPPRSRKRSSRLALPVQKPNPDTVRSFMRDCLVPILAEEFLRRRQVEAEQSILRVTPGKPTTEPFGKEGGL